MDSSNILMKAATASNVAIELLMPRIPLLSDEDMKESRFEDGNFRWEHYVPYMVIPHLVLEFGYESNYHPNNMALYLNGTYPNHIRLELYESQLVHGLADAYRYQNPASNMYNVSDAMCRSIYKCLYRSIDQEFRYLNSGIEMYDVISKLQNTSHAECLEYCLGKKYIPSMFKAGGLHVGLILVNFILWQYSDHKVFSTYFLPRGELDIIRDTITDGLDTKEFWEQLASDCIVSVEDLKEVYFKVE